MRTINRWLFPDSHELETHEVLQEPSYDSRVFWLSGLAGTGKSTIAQTIAESCHASRFLGASFFCSRAHSECSDIHFIFSTIAYQLGQFYPEFKAKTAEALLNDPDIGFALIPRQLKGLIVDPLRDLPNFPACAVIIDALDECKDSKATSLILDAIAQHIHDLAPLKFVITSRPVANITQGFRSAQLAQATQHFVLHDVPLELTTRDIGSYLHTELTRVREAYDLEDSWPAREDISRVVGMSKGLFIFAATVVRFVEDPNASLPKEQLHLLLDGSADAPGQSTAFNQLNELYLQVLRTAFPSITRNLMARLKTVLGAIVLLRDQLPPSAIEDLMQLEPGTVQTTLLHLHSLITTPQEEGGTVGLIHPSFPDFLIDDNRCRDHNFLIIPSIQHTVIAQFCLRTMTSMLRKDICQIGSIMLNIEVPSLSERIAAYIPPHLQYSCRHWAYHLCQGEIDNDIFRLFEEFSARYLLNWLEIMSLLGCLQGVVTALQSVERKLSVSAHSCLLLANILKRDMQGLPLPSSYTLGLLQDCKRAIQQSFAGLNASCLQPYHGLLAFCPKSCRFAQQYAPHAEETVRLVWGQEVDWNPCSLVLEGHREVVDHAVFSMDGQRIVSVGRDKTAILWDAATGARLHTLENSLGEDEGFNGILFSPDGSEIVAGSDAGKVFVWDASSGRPTAQLAKDAKYAYCYDYSPDSSLLAVALDNAIALWDRSGQDSSPSILHAHTEDIGIDSIRFSPRTGKLLVSIHDDGFCRLWDVKARSCTRNFKIRSGGKDSVVDHMAMFSADESAIVYISSPGSISLYGVPDGRLIKQKSLQFPSKGEEDGSSAFDLSPDGKTVAAAGRDQAIWIMDVATGRPVQQLRSSIPHLAFLLNYSPDGTRLISCGGDEHIRVWHVEHSSVPQSRTKAIAEKIKLHSRRLSSMISDETGYPSLSLDDFGSWCTALSPDGSLLAIGTRKGSIMLWDLRISKRLQTLSGSGDFPSSLHFLPDNQTIISCDSPYVKVWDTVEGRCVAQLKAWAKQVIVQAVQDPPGTKWFFCVLTHRGDVELYTTSAIQQVDQAEKATLVDADWGKHRKWSKTNAIAFPPTASHIAFHGTLDDHRLGDVLAIGIVQLSSRRELVLVYDIARFGKVELMTFSADASRLASATHSGTIMLWDVPTEPSSPSPSAPSASTKIAPALPLATFTIGQPIRLMHLFFSQDQRAIITDASFHPIPPQHVPKSPPALLLDTPSSSPVVYLSPDGWIWRIVPSGEKAVRVCWVPPAFKTHTRELGDPTMFTRGNRVVLITQAGRFILINLSAFRS